MIFSRWVSRASAGLAMIGLATMTQLPSAEAINIDPVQLTAQQIKYIVTGTTLAGKTSDVPIRIFFDPAGTFRLAVKKAGNLPQQLSGSWYVEPEADLLCFSIGAGDGGRQCWIVRRGDTIEFVSSKGSLAPLDVPLRVINFSVQEAGLKMEFPEPPSPPPPPSVAAYPAPEYPAINNFAIRHNRDIYGSDILTPAGQIGIAGLDINDCASECERTATCVAFSVDRWVGRCYLKNEITTSLLDPRSSIAVKKPQELPNVSTIAAEIEVVHRRRFRGELLARRRMLDLPACRASCETDVRCVGFTFQRRQGQAENCDTFRMMEGYEADNTADGGFKFQPPN